MTHLKKYTTVFVAVLFTKGEKMNTFPWNAIADIITGEPMHVLHMRNGLYMCPIGQDGKRLGPLVGYAGTYPDEDGMPKQWVGDVYVNFAKIDEYPGDLHDFARKIRNTLRNLNLLHSMDVFCGAPIGGYSFSHALGAVRECRVIKAEKKVLRPATSMGRERSKLVFARHAVEQGERVAIVEDVCNNFSTTEQLISLIEQSGGTAVSIICILNRSLTVDDTYTSANGTKIPVVSLVRLPIKEYRQDDPVVAEDIANGNVVWKPKNEWPRLMEAMKNAASKQETP